MRKKNEHYYISKRRKEKPALPIVPPKRPVEVQRLPSFQYVEKPSCPQKERAVEEILSKL